jgi:YfiH family protein
MIQPPGFTGVAFGTAAEGDARTDEAARARFSAVGSPPAWAYVSQVHGARVVTATRAGHLGDGDAIVTVTPDLAITVATADCVPIAIEGVGFTSIVHAGWRGLAAGVIPATLAAIRRLGLTPLRAAVGPAIGPCCYEVGSDVLDSLRSHRATTTWGTDSVDLVGAVISQLQPLDPWVSGRCTMTDGDLFSYRRDRTKARQVAVAWLPSA